MSFFDSLSRLFPLIVLLLAPMFVAGLLVLAWKKWFKGRNRRSPLTSELLRTPGYGLREKIDSLDLDIDTHLVVLTMLPLILYASWLQERVLVGPSGLPVGGWLFVIAGITVIVFGLVKLLKLVVVRQKFREARDGELATAQLMEQLIARGGRLFHDIQAKGFNIDHVVVAPGGVFAVETKHRLKPVKGSNKQNAIVRTDGRRLMFPGWAETKPLEQAKAQAAWLAGELTQATGARVIVKPVVALPGWYVERTAPGGVLAINPKNCAFMAKPVAGEERLTVEQIRSISYQLARLCRIPELEQKK